MVSSSKIAENITDNCSTQLEALLKLSISDKQVLSKR